MKPTELIVVPFAVSETEYNLLVVMQADNIQRLRDYDPAEVPLQHLPDDVCGNRKLKNVILAYATTEEVNAMLADAVVGGALEPHFKKLSRGWKYRPELGDSEKPPIQFKPPMGRG